MSYGQLPTSALGSNDRLLYGYGYSSNDPNDRPRSKSIESAREPSVTGFGSDQQDARSLQNDEDDTPDIIRIQYGTAAFQLEYAHGSLFDGKVSVRTLRKSIAYDQELSTELFEGIISYNGFILDNDTLPLRNVGCESGSLLVIVDSMQQHEVQSRPQRTERKAARSLGEGEKEDNDDDNKFEHKYEDEDEDEDENLKLAIALSMQVNTSDALDDESGELVESHTSDPGRSLVRIEANSVDEQSAGFNSSTMSRNTSNEHIVRTLQVTQHEGAEIESSQSNTCQSPTANNRVRGHEGSRSLSPHTRHRFLPDANSHFLSTESEVTRAKNPDMDSVSQGHEPYILAGAKEVKGSQLENEPLSLPIINPAASNEFKDVQHPRLGPALSQSLQIHEHIAEPQPWRPPQNLTTDVEVAQEERSTLPRQYSNNVLSSDDSGIPSLPSDDAVNKDLCFLLSASAQFWELRTQLIPIAEYHVVRNTITRSLRRQALRCFRVARTRTERKISMLFIGAASDQCATDSVVCDSERSFSQQAEAIQSALCRIFEWFRRVGSIADLMTDFTKLQSSLHYFSALTRDMLNRISHETFLSEVAFFTLQSLGVEAAAEILSARRDGVTFTSQLVPTLENKCKEYIEDWTNVQWNWWPLGERQYPVRKHHIRISWQCFCSKVLSVDLSEGQANLIASLFEWNFFPTKLNHLCKWRSQGLGPTQMFMDDTEPIFTNLVPTNNTTTPTPLHRRNTSNNSSSPASPTTSRSSTAQTSQGSASSVSRTSSPSSAATQVSAEISIPMPTSGKFILVGFKGVKRSLDLITLNVSDPNNAKLDDAEFFTHLRSSYRASKRWIRFYLSVWKMNHCDFVKFENYKENCINDVCRDLPESPDYGYNPRPPKASITNPGISKHVFEQALLTPCGINICGLKLRCPFTWLSLGCHECLLPLAPGHRFYLNRIPQKMSPWLIDSIGDINYAWGIKIETEVRALHVLIYHLLMLIGPFAIWAWMIWWNKQHTGPAVQASGSVLDLQNPSVPATTAIALMSLFWAVARPLGVLRQDSTR